MSYHTEQMDEILTSPKAMEMVQDIAHIYGDARVALWLFQTIGAELDDMAKWTAETAQQVLPTTATWALDYWEQSRGIPRDPTLSIQKRRERILAYLSNRAPMNPATLARIASAAAENAECRIEERSRGGAWFTVWISAMPSDTDREKIRAAVERAKQARLSFDVKYEQQTMGEIRVGGYVRIGESLTVRMVN